MSLAPNRAPAAQVGELGVGGRLGCRAANLVEAHLRVTLVDSNAHLLLIYLLLVLTHHHWGHLAAVNFLESQVWYGVVRQVRGPL